MCPQACLPGLFHHWLRPTWRRSLRYGSPLLVGNRPLRRLGLRLHGRHFWPSVRLPKLTTMEGRIGRQRPN